MGTVERRVIHVNRGIGLFASQDKTGEFRLIPDALGDNLIDTDAAANGPA